MTVSGVSLAFVSHGLYLSLFLNETEKNGGGPFRNMNISDGEWTRSYITQASG
jgi:hypothetical protein